MSAHRDTFVRDNLPPRELWPELRFDLPELQFPARYNASSLLDAAIANGFGDNAAILCKDGPWTYMKLLEGAGRVARALTTKLGLVPGNRVLIHAPNSPWAMVAWWGVIRAGGVAVATMPLLRRSELGVLIEKANISHALVDEALMSEVEAAGRISSNLRCLVGFDDLEELVQSAESTFAPILTTADDPALIAFTSGTTGNPKGCVHFHRDVAAMAATFSRHILRPKSSDVFCGTPPFAFTFGLGASVVFPAACGAATALPEKPGFEALADTIAQHKATTLFTSPTGYRALLKLGVTRLASLHTCVSAGEHLPKATSDQWYEATGIRIIDGIGSTEMIHIFISARGDDIRPGATGKPVPGYVARLLDENNVPIEGAGTGRLAVRGPTGCRYLADDRQRSYVIDGWNVTGDIYERDEDGYFWFVSRADDMIVSAGYNIAAPEVENALLTHESVAEAAVIGVPDEERGHIVKAFVVLTPTTPANHATVQTLQDHVKQAIAPYKYPRAIEFVAELPKTLTGKLQRYRLRERS
jgi:2-aminobenzoate-CoA ligase